MTTAKETPARAPRKRGTWGGISRAHILEAAKKLDPESITMQKVADELGVDRKALNYHVTDRDGLLGLVAADTFAEQMTSAPIEVDGTWKDTVRSYIVMTRDSLIATGVLASYFRIDTELSILQPAEIALEKLVGAGFDERTAGRALQHMTNVAMGLGRDAILQQEQGGHPQMPELAEALKASDGSDNLTVVRHLIASGESAYDAGQFDFEVDVVIGGLEKHLETTGQTGRNATRP